MRDGRCRFIMYGIGLRLDGACFFIECLQIIHLHSIIQQSCIFQSQCPIPKKTAINPLKPSSTTHLSIHQVLKYNFIMNLSQQAEIDTSVHLCTFECYIRQANITMKFPCTYFVQWRTVNAKSTARTEKHSPQQNTVNFQERITLAVEMLYDHNKLEFLKRETIVELYLISRSRPDQNKLVGRVNVDLGKVINVGMYESPTQFKLNFCSIQGNLIMQFKAKEQRLTNLTVQDLDKSSFIDFISQNALKNQSRNQSMILSRHQNHNAQRRSVEKATRSQIRSPFAQAKESIKSNFNSKGSLVKAEAEKLFAVPSENQPSSPKARISDEFQAKSKIISSHIKVKTEENPQIFQQQEQIVIESKLQHVPSTHNIKKDDQMPAQMMSFQNFGKKISDVMVEQSPSYTNQEFVLNDIKEVQDQQLSERKRQHELIIAEKEQQILSIEAEAKRIKEEYYVLMAENGEIKEERTRLSDLVKTLSSQLQEERRLKSKGQEEISSLKAQLNQRDSLIQQLQREVESLKKPSEAEVYKTRIAVLQASNTQITTQLQQYQTKLSQQAQQINSYQASIKRLERQNSQILLKIQSQKATESSLQAKLQSFESENSRLASHLQDYKKKYELQADALKQSIDLQRHQQEIQQLQALVSRLQGDRQSATMRYQTAEQELTYLQGKYMELQASKQPDVQTSQVIQNDNLSEVVQRVDKIVVEDMETQRLRQENAGLINEIQYLKQSLQTAERKAKQESDLRKEEARTHEDKVTSLQQEIEGLINANTQLQELARTRDQLYRDNEALKGEIQQLNRQLFEGQDSNLAKMLQQQNQELREQSKAVQSQIQFYEKQLTILKEEIVRIRKNRETPVERIAVSEYEQAIAKLNNNLEEQINQNNELSQAIVRYMEKQAKMKETLAVLQKESKEIFTLVQEKQQNEETYQKAIEELQCQIASLREGQVRTAEISNKTYQQTTDQSHNDQLLKLQEKLLGENAQLAAANSEIREINTRLNEELMQLSIQHNDFRQQAQEQLSTLKKQEEGYIVRIRDLQQGMKNKEVEIEIWKARSTQREGQKQVYEQEIGRLRGCMQEIQEEKFNLESSNNQKDIRIIQLQQEITNFMNSLNTPPQNSTTAPVSTTTPTLQISLFSQLKDRLLTRTLSSDWQSLLQNVLDRSMLQEETSKLLNLQEKGRLLSKELQKVKATLLKSDWRNHQQKIAAMSLFKKCESIVTELISAAESLNQNQSSFL